MIRHIPQSFRARAGQAKTAKEIYALVAEASPSEFQDPLAVSTLYAQFGKFHRHCGLPQDKTNVVLNKLATLETSFTTPSSLVQSIYGMSLLECKSFPKSWQEQIVSLDLQLVVFPDLVKLIKSFAALQRRQCGEDVDRVAGELLKRREELAQAPLTHLTSLLSSLASLSELTPNGTQLADLAWWEVQRQQAKLKQELIPELLCSAGRLGFGKRPECALNLELINHKMDGVKSPALVANWALGLSYFDQAKPSAFAVLGQNVAKRKLNEFVLVDLIKIHLAFQRKQVSDVQFEQRWHQLLRNRKVLEDKVEVKDAEFGFAQALELVLLHVRQVSQSQSPPPPHQLLDDLAFVARGNLKSASAGELAMLLEGMRALRYRNVDFFQHLLEEFSAHRKLRSFSPTELVRIVHTVAWFDYAKAGDVVDAISNHLVREELSFSNWLKLAWSLQSLEHRNAQPLLEATMRNDSSSWEEKQMYAQLFHSPQPSPSPTGSVPPMLAQARELILARYPSANVTGAVLTNEIPVDMYIPELNLAINVDVPDALDCKLETRLGPARFKRKQLKQLGYLVLNVNHFMLREENLDKFFATLT